MYTNIEQQHLMEQSKLLLQEKIGFQSKKEEVEVLRKLIEFHEWRYYVLNDPLLSDFEYDTLFKKLEKIEQDYPELYSTGSPTQRVSKDLVEEFNSVQHLSPMLSLSNSYNIEDLTDFEEQLKRFAGISENEEVQYSVEPKFDGGTIVLLYENDKLVRAATRGDGTKGEEITLNAKTIKSIPLFAKFSEHGIRRAELRGEVLIRKDVFNKLNTERQSQNLTLFANPRNAATGGLRVKDPSDAAKRKLDAFVYQLSYAEDINGSDCLKKFTTHSNTLNTLKLLGFKVPEKEMKVCKGAQEVHDYCAQWQDKRDSYEYELDGMVIKLDNLQLQEEAGYTNHHPRWAIAFKFQAKQATSKLLNVEFQVGKIGTITPVAKLEPVALAGVTVSSVSLHNEDFIRTKDIRIGDTVLVERAGDVIPYIVKPLEDIRTGEEKIIEFPKYCPFDESQEIELIRAEGEAAWRCPDCVCGKQVLQKLIFHVSKDAMDIEGLGKSIVERLYDLGWVNRIPDIYQLDYSKLATLEGFGERSANNIKSSIEAAKSRPIHRLLYSLSIHHLGQKVAKLLAEKINHVLDLCNWEESDYTSIRDIGPTVAKNAYRYFHQESNFQMLQDLERLGVNLTQTNDDQPLKIAEDAPLAGKTILFTGTLTTLSRKEAEEKAAAAGARNISAVSSKLDYLIVGENAGSKLEKAQKLGSVNILTENEFINLIQSLEI